MRITFTGKQEKLAPTQERKLATAFARLSKLIERGGEKAALVALSSQRHLQMAEVRLNFYDQTMIGKGKGVDQFTALMEAVENVERQALKSREKWRDSKRETPERKVRSTGEPLPEPVAAKAPKGAKAAKAAPARAAAKKRASKAKKPAQVIQASRDDSKPMTVEEAMMELEGGGDYVAYRDAETDRVRVLIRRSDGQIDLVEA
jgi:ribosome-associated translation inhibitor RaiA